MTTLPSPRSARRAGLVVAAAASIAAIGCEQFVERDRRLSSFEVKLTTPVGSPDRRCPLPGTPTVGVDLTGCPTYRRTAAGTTEAVVGISATALDEDGNVYETYNSVAEVRVQPGVPSGASLQLRFVNGVAQGVIEGRAPEIAFQGAFGDTWIWVTDTKAPPRRTDIVGLGQACSAGAPAACDQFGLTCVATRRAVGFDPLGLTYCSSACTSDADCGDGYLCTSEVTPYGPLSGDSACVRRPPSFAVGAAGPVHLLEPNVADLNRADSLVFSPFDKQFVEVKRGNMVVTAVQITGFYVTDTCTTPGYQGSGNEACGADDKAQREEFNHLFVYTFNRPDELFVGDRVTNVSGPISEFNGLTELTFPLWEIDFDRSPQPIPEPVDLNSKIVDRFPWLVADRGACRRAAGDPTMLALVDCDLAMERVEAARIRVRVRSVVPIVPGSREESNFERFGQWPVIVDDGSRDGRTFQMITRENIPFFDPRRVGGRAIDQPVTGNLRQIAFDDRSEPIWIVEPRDPSDCPWCQN
jgi:hypothetical protein